jgi:hypothetical protein
MHSLVSIATDFQVVPGCILGRRTQHYIVIDLRNLGSSYSVKQVIILAVKDISSNKVH